MVATKVIPPFSTLVVHLMGALKSVFIRTGLCSFLMLNSRVDNNAWTQHNMDGFGWGELL